jgi:hypothetical protein
LAGSTIRFDLVSPKGLLVTEPVRFTLQELHT